MWKYEEMNGDGFCWFGRFGWIGFHFMYVCIYVHIYISIYLISSSILLSLIALACADVKFPDLGTDICNGSHAPDPGPRHLCGVVRPTGSTKLGPPGLCPQPCK